jgi:tRNA-binding EMAP/Myf-like protein
MKDGIIYADWQKIDVRLGRIVAASNPEWSNKLIELHVDFGSVIGERTIFTGLRSWYTPEQMQGKQAMFIINLPYKKMADGNSAPVVLLFDDIAPAGSPLA